MEVRIFRLDCERFSWLSCSIEESFFSVCLVFFIDGFPNVGLNNSLSKISLVKCYSRWSEFATPAKPAS